MFKKITDFFKYSKSNEVHGDDYRIHTEKEVAPSLVVTKKTQNKIKIPRPRNVNQTQKLTYCPKEHTP